MPPVYVDISPTLTVATTGLQQQVPSIGARWKRDGQGGFSMGSSRVGACAAIATYWLSKRTAGTVVRAPHQLFRPDGCGQSAFSIAQAVYVMARSHEKLMAIYGLRILARHERFDGDSMPTSVLAGCAVAIACDRSGLFYMAMNGRETGHAFGIATRPPWQFFDVNEGIFTFLSLKEMRIWIPRYIAAGYPDCSESMQLLEVGRC